MGDSDIPLQRRSLRAQAERQRSGIGRPACIEVFRQQMRQFRLACLVVGDEQKANHPAAGVPPWQIALQHLPGFGVFDPGEQVVTVD